MKNYLVTYREVDSCVGSVRRVTKVAAKSKVEALMKIINVHATAACSVISVQRLKTRRIYERV